MSHFVFLLILFAFFGSSAHADGHEPEFAYIESTGRGPSNWSQLNQSWFLCNSGSRQSPIAIFSPLAQFKPSLGPLRPKYQTAPATLLNRGHDIKLMWTGNAGNVIIEGTVYNLTDTHWHIPSEHKINGISFAMEQHLVHKSSAGKIAVIGILFKYGDRDPFLSMLYPKILALEDGAKEEDLGDVDPNDINKDYDRGFNSYFRYNGSLTTPPCSENVTWTLLKKVKTVSRRQVRALQEAVDEGYERNARPIQPLNGRPVYFY